MLHKCAVYVVIVYARACTCVSSTHIYNFNQLNNCMPPLTFEYKRLYSKARMNKISTTQMRFLLLSPIFLRDRALRELPLTKIGVLYLMNRPANILSLSLKISTS
jgi:hypothetical protein